MAAAEAIAPMISGFCGRAPTCCALQQRWPEAEAGFEHLLSVYPHFDEAVLMLGICKLQLGQSEDAIPLFQKVIRDDPRNPDIWPYYVRLGEASAAHREI